MFPMTAPEAEPPMPVTNVRKIGMARHVFTHQVWQMQVFAADTETDAKQPDRFVGIREMEELPLPTAMRGPAAMARLLLTENKG